MQRVLVVHFDLKEFYDGTLGLFAHFLELEAEYGASQEFPLQNYTDERKVHSFCHFKLRIKGFPPKRGIIFMLLEDLYAWLAILLHFIGVFMRFRNLVNSPQINLWQKNVISIKAHN